MELMLADLAHCERRLEKTTCKGEERAALEAVVAALEAGTPARAAGLSDEAGEPHSSVRVCVATTQTIDNSDH